MTTALRGSIFPSYCFLIAIAIFSMRGSICRNDFAPWRKQPDRLLAGTEKRRSETSCLIVKAILRCVPGQSMLVSHLMPPKSRAHVFFDIGNSSHLRDVHLIGSSTLYRACVNLCLIKHVMQLSHGCCIPQYWDMWRPFS